MQRVGQPSTIPTGNFEHVSDLKFGMSLSAVPFALFQTGDAQLMISPQVSSVTSCSSGARQSGVTDLDAAVALSPWGDCHGAPCHLHAHDVHVHVDSVDQRSHQVPQSAHHDLQIWYEGYSPTPPRFLPDGCQVVVFHSHGAQPFLPDEPVRYVCWRILRRSGTKGNRGILESRPWENGFIKYHDTWKLENDEYLTTEYWFLHGHDAPPGFQTPGRISTRYEIVDEQGIPSALGPYIVYEVPNPACHDPEENMESTTWIATTKKMRKNAGKMISNKKHSSKTAFAEVFFPARISPMVRQLGLPVHDQASFDLVEGWDVRKGADRQRFWKSNKSRLHTC